MPRWENGKLVPRPFVLRVYVAATPDGWKVMPGGFARVSDKPDARAVSMGEGVESADVWVLADKPVVTASLLPSPEKAHIARLLGNLPSRAADNLFWFGRYLERAEATLRLVRCLSARAVDPEAPASGARGVVEGLKSLLIAWGAVDAEAKDAAPRRNGAAHRARITARRCRIANAANFAASVIRERLTQQTWTLIGRLKSGLRRTARARPLSDAEIIDRIDEQLTTIAALSGLFDENFNRGAGWRFYELGRRIERGINTCRISRQFAHQKATGARSRRAARPHQFADHLSLAHADRRRARARCATWRCSTPTTRARSRSRPSGSPSISRRCRCCARTAFPRSRCGWRPGSAPNSSPRSPTSSRTPASSAIENRLAQLAEAIGRRYFLHGASARAEKVMGLG